MTNEAKDKLLRDRINTLDTLSGGIVFGREEAWEKLQQRIEQKPAKKIAMKYWLAAAAVLLLIVSVAGLYYRPANEIASNTKTDANSNIVATGPINIPVAIAQPESMQVTTVTSVSKATNVPVVNVPGDVQAPQCTVIIEQPEPQQEHQYPDDNKIVTIEQPAPAKPSPQPMKVIHINDLYHKDVPQATQAAASTYASVDVSSLPVVHINDVIHEEHEVRQILKENRASFIHISFMQYGYPHNTSSDADESNIPHTLKIRFNPQN